MSISQKIEYKKEFLPGYTGHVPEKTSLFGCTAGDINKIVTNQGAKPGDSDVHVAVSKPYFQRHDYLVNPP